MSDTFLITPYKVRSAGTEVPPEEVQAAINSLAQQATIALNSVASDPTGPAGGDLGGTYPNPTVVNLHVTGGTESGVAVTGNTINSSPIGQTTPAAGAFTTLTATTPVGVASGGTGQNTLSAHNVLIGEGTGAVGFAAPSTAGKMLISQGAAVDPAFANNPVITGGTVDGAPVGGTTPSTGAFTTLSASSTVSGAGFTALFASPPPTGSTAPNTGSFTNLTASGTLSGFPGRLLNVQTITSTQTYTPTTGTNKIFIRIGAGGGAGGGAAATGSGQFSTGGGGGAGAIAEAFITSAFSGVTVTIGAAGTPNSGATGGNGGNSTFGAIVTANGGAGGPSSAAGTSAFAAGGVGGTSSGGSLNGSGADGMWTWANATLANSGVGANSMFGRGGQTVGLGVAAVAASGFCAGGGGACLGASSAAIAGGAGAPGFCQIWEFS